MAKTIKQVEGIGPRYAQALVEMGINSTDKLLTAGSDRRGRQELAMKTGITETAILKWVNMCDLFRIKGVAGQYAELLEAAGVDTVRELAQRNAENLAKAMAVCNEQKRLVRQVPSVRMVEEWVEQAKSLPPKVFH